MQFKQAKLDNGLNVIAECDDSAHTSAVGFFVKTGARDEQQKLMGVSHFLEHMMFKGTASRSADDVNREFDEMGASYNAFTSHEQTVYYAHILPEFFPRAVELLGDMLRPALREDDFKMEKNVILEEIGMYEDRPEWQLQDTLLEEYYANHPMGFRVLGTQKTVGDLTAKQMRSYFQQRYSPDNMVVSAAGKIDFQKFVDDLSALTSSWNPIDARRQHGQFKVENRSRNLIDKKLHRHYVAILSPAPSAQDNGRYAARVLADVLGDSEGSRLYWALVDPGLADEADFSFMPQDGTGGYLAYASCDPSRAGQVEEKLIQTIDTFSSDINDMEVQRAKNKLATGATLQGERPAGRMRSLGMQWSYIGEYISLDQELEKLMAVTADDLRELISSQSFTPRTTVRLGPGE